MRKSTALELAKDYCSRWAVPWQRLLRTETTRSFWLLFVEWRTFTIATGVGEAQITLHAPTTTIHSLVCTPNEPHAFLLPLWVAFPTFNSVTCGWRQGHGEEYKYRWHGFYRSLSPTAKTEYQLKYPPPDNEELCWHGFYEAIADIPAGNDNPVGDCIIGRV